MMDDKALMNRLREQLLGPSTSMPIERAHALVDEWAGPGRGERVIALGRVKNMWRMRDGAIVLVRARLRLR